MTLLLSVTGHLSNASSAPALAALTSPHGVDRYLEEINPMWAATEVRARVGDITRETEGENPVATLTLQPTSTWRGRRAGQYVQVGVEINAARRTTTWSPSLTRNRVNQSWPCIFHGADG
jgi:hypothetical protein